VGIPNYIISLAPLHSTYKGKRQSYLFTSPPKATNDLPAHTQRVRGFRTRIRADDSGAGTIGSHFDVNVRGDRDYRGVDCGCAMGKDKVKLRWEEKRRG
jgi:hypothetical protein